MLISKIDKVERELNRLQDAIREARKAHTENSSLTAALSSEEYAFRFNPKNLDSPKHTGALKRASMDLTRALADLRKPG